MESKFTKKKVHEALMSLPFVGYSNNIQMIIVNGNSSALGPEKDEFCGPNM